MFTRSIYKKDLHTPKALSKVSAGFTLIETLVSMFIFVLVIAAVSQIFTQAFSGYRYEKSVQLDLETAQFVVNTMAKELRTASVVSPASSATTAVRFYDYSQNLCFLYQISLPNLTVNQATATDALDCSGKSLSSGTVIATGITDGHFSVVPSDKIGKVIGKVTISLQIGTGLTHKANIQTSVSLRDYANAGL